MRKGAGEVMEFLRRYRRRGSFVLALVVPLGVAAVLVPFRGTSATTAAALVLVAVLLASVVGATLANETRVV
jgi:hypothetical protein